MKHLSKVLLLTLLFLPVLAAEPRSHLASEAARQRGPSRLASMYRFAFTLRIFEGTQEQIRQFELILEDRSEGKVRSLIKIPVRQGDAINYVDTGIKCDTQFQEIEGAVRLETELTYTDLANSTPTADAPRIHEWQTRVNTIVMPNRSTLLSSYDGGTGSRRYRLEVLAEKLK